MAIARQEENTPSLAVTTSDLNKTARPTILVFDSGVGGLSVYKEIRKLLPDLHYIYAFDNEAFPYGEKTADVIIDRVVKVVDAIQKKHPLAVVVIACNTASTVSLPVLRERFSFPVVGVVPAIKPAAKLSCNRIVGLLATRATVNRGYTKELITRFATDCQVHSIGSAELVELAERKLHGKDVPLDELEKVLKPWLRMKEPPDTVILGCTHFPLIAEELSQVLPDGTRLIDSGAAIARRTAWLIKNRADLFLTTVDNLAYCTKLDADSEALSPVLYEYGFLTLEKLAT
ncbi:glutamate racemase [Xenorhabdus nematophila]|uniref:Glutamate racemase n=1 Tax=Xenorhabdus nematophila (strain ATCC 19061 / DSM 3370 / CCUG 14189 / LMG 1036 / NCIMB 9965 / AN6) TaxID=406817 RepID=D3VH82_XENNA|nr:glutamate racemase [Xenorhabdus nematophila]CEF30264.1 glutamate racemase [Xenorhabdus nematophila str. Websteri]AYA41474.1 glutamate racemase [Xenorhabdus nematophila]MBA0020211.1 glutamate racemase [Xenorhabdus nematophila]MCB4426651.1 glutamate racemase [Xenorhabdus nematophila]QNJ35861.1 glutamate racemase [Xenorhabdus nematophila]